MSAAQISTFTPTGDEFNIVDAAVPGLVLRLGPTGGNDGSCPSIWRFTSAPGRLIGLAIRAERISCKFDAGSNNLCATKYDKPSGAYGLNDSNPCPSSAIGAGRLAV